MSDLDIVKLASSAQEEVSRQLAICNACRYCEGLCAVFPAMELRRDFSGADVDYLSNLCHNCGACYYACQYAPPHEFAINVPRAMTQLREETYTRYAWPNVGSLLFKRNGLWIALITAFSVALFVAGMVLWHSPNALFQSYTGAGAFYRLMPHGFMVLLFSAPFVYAIFAMAMSVHHFWQRTGSTKKLAKGSIWTAVHNAVTLRYLGGGGRGCMNDGERPDDRRRHFHHLTSGGFLFCFMSTCSGTVFHYLGYEAPYPWWHPTVVLGLLGGIGLLAGPTGLMYERRRRASEIMSSQAFDMGATFLVMLVLTSATGFLLLFFRSTALMGSLLTIHLGIVFALFMTFPYSKFVHGLYRGAALVRHAHEQHAERQP